MSLRDGPLSDIKPPPAWLAVAALVLVAILSMALFAGGRHGAAVSSASRGADGALGAAGGVL